MAEAGEYTFLAWLFNRRMDMDTEEGGFTEESDSQHEVVLEEFDEYEEAYENGELDEVAEEMADVLITIFIQADRMGIDIASAYNRKMEYNMDKSGDRNKDGKVKDDAEIEKPDFSRFTDGFYK